MPLKKAQTGPFAFFFTSLAPSQATESLTLDEAFLQALNVADPLKKSAMRIYRGGLLLNSGSRKPQAITVKKYSCQSYTYSTDSTLHSVRLGDLTETLLERWNTFDKSSLWYFLANHATDVTVVSELRPGIVEAMDAHLRAYSRYLGVVSPDLGNPLHRELLVELLFKDVFIRDGIVYACRDLSGELHTSFYGVKKITNREMVALDTNEFDSSAPPFNSSIPLSARGLITQQRLEKLSKLDIHQRLMQSISYTSEASKLQFDWDLSQLPDSQDEISVHARKLTNYLLDADGKDPSKAKFFRTTLQIGPEDWAFLHAQLVDGLSSLDFENVCIKDDYGIRFNARFPVTGINGATATIMTAWIVRRGERAAFVTAYPLKKDATLEAFAQQPLVIRGLPAGDEKWAAVHALAQNYATAMMLECVPKPMVIGGDVVMQGTIGTAYVVVHDGRSSFARWAKVNNIGYTHRPRGIAINAMQVGLSSELASAYAKAYAKVLLRNGIECKVETYLD